MKKLTKKDIKKGDRLLLGYDGKSYRCNDRANMQQIHPSTANYYSNYSNYASIKKAEPYEHYIMII